MNEYIRTDLAAECRTGEKEGALPGVEFTETEHGKLKLSKLSVTSPEGVKAIGKPMGNYTTINFGKLWLEDNTLFDDTQRTISNEVRNMAQSLAPGFKTVLVVGLGNRHMTTDSVGPESVSMITVTRHIKEYDEGLFEKIGQLEVAALTPGVVGETGIETVELVKSAVKTVNPQLVIVIDALAARSPDRLVSTVQISDSGISPGSGVGNSRKAISRETLGIPVIAIGVPTVVDSSTLVYDALEKAGIKDNDISEGLKQILENGRSFFVSIKDSDVAVKQLSELISGALDEALVSNTNVR